MAGTKIRGITVQIGGDTSELQKSLKSANGEIQSTQKQLKDVEKLLKFDPSNLELLEQKQKLLNDRVEQTNKKLESLKQIEKELKNSGVDENSAQFQALRREIIDTESALKNAEESAKGFNASLASASANLDSFADKAGTVAEKTKALSMAGASVVAGLTGIAIQSVKTADDLNTLAKQTGISTAELQKMQYASDLVDVSVEDITGAVKKLKSNMASSSASTVSAFEQIGVSVRNADGSFRDVNDVFNDALIGLSKIQNETERDTIAMTLFGKSADSLAGIIDDGGEALRQYGADAENLGLILDQDTLNSLNAVNDKLDELKAKLSAQLTVSGAKALEALTPVIESVVQALTNLLEWVGNLSSEQIKMILIIAGVVASISPIAGIISSITSAVSGFISFLPTLTSGLSAVMGFISANPWTLVIAGIIALVGVIIANWDTIKGVLTAIWETVQDVFGKIKDFILDVVESIKNAIKTVINFFIGLINGAINGINTLIRGLNSIKFDVPDWLPLIGGKSFGFNLKEIANIPQLASGGKVANGSAIVGERGAEVLTVSNGQASVQPLTNNYTTNNYTQTSNQPLQVELTLDGMTLARQMVHPNNRASRLAGGSCIV